MIKRFVKYAIITGSFLTLAPIVASAQVTYELTSNPAIVTHISSSRTYSSKELSQLLAPIALYPDTLLAQVLMASTYPLDVTEAASWLQRNNHTTLSNEPLEVSLRNAPWAPSVKALIAFPDVIRMMNSNLQWMEQVGSAFVGQSEDVMNEIQHLRRLANETGKLFSTAQQTVSLQGNSILIEPTVSESIYIPVYNPMLVYGRWPYDAYPPYYLTPHYGYSNARISFSPSIIIYRPLYFVLAVDFKRHRIHIDDRYFTILNRGHGPHKSGIWNYDREHRHDEGSRRDRVAALHVKQPMFSEHHQTRNKVVRTQPRDSRRDQLESNDPHFVNRTTNQNVAQLNPSQRATQQARSLRPPQQRAKVLTPIIPHRRPQIVRNTNLTTGRQAAVTQSLRRRIERPQRATRTPLVQVPVHRIERVDVQAELQTTKENRVALESKTKYRRVNDDTRHNSPENNDPEDRDRSFKGRHNHR